jgi:hypothetical protein
MNNNRTGSRISSERSPLERMHLANTITAQVGEGVCNVYRASGTDVNHIEWADRRFQEGITLVPFCSIRRNHLLSQ